MQLRGKTAIVTGGTRSLGRRIAEALLLDGASVVCAARSEGELNLLTEVGGNRVAYHPVDVRDRASVDTLMKFCVDRFGGLDVLVANAGVSRDGPIANIDAVSWWEVMETNLGGVFHSVQSALPHLQAHGGGRIFTLSSVLSTRVAPGAGAYSCSKAAVDMFTKVCAAEFAAFGITVNALAPGFVDEGMGQRLADDELVWDTYRERMLSGRPGTGAEIGKAAVFLASEQSSYVNGHVLEVSGGLLWA